MAKGRKTHPREYRERLVEMYRAGRSAESLAKDFEPAVIDKTLRHLRQKGRDARAGP